MADESVVAAEVLPGSDTQYSDNLIAGVAITAGQACYLDTATNTVKLADSNASSATAAAKGVSMHAAGIGQPIKVAISGSIDPGFTVTVGSRYYTSATAGGITKAEATDLPTGVYPFLIGWGITASSLRLVMSGAGVAVPA